MITFDIPVALIFFNRPSTLRIVFEQVKKIMPSKLFLIQDGARNGNDKLLIQDCRDIVADIDWDCEVHTNFSEKNLGCGQRPASGINWVFENVDKAIILEDDCVPEQSFFYYCKEMLNKYENDTRICYISGLNHFEEWECGDSDYFFAKTGAIWGWATWRRVWSKYYDYYVKNLDDEYSKKLIRYQITNPRVAKSRIAAWQSAYDSKNSNKKLSYWDAQWGYVKYSQSMLVVVPKFNQIRNIGIGESSTHARSFRQEAYKKYKSFFFIPTKPLHLPIKHPDCMVCDIEYDNLVYKHILGNPLRRWISSIVLKLLTKGEYTQ